MLHHEPRLTVISEGPLRGRTYQLREGQTLLGRDDAADVVLAAPGLSRRHAYVSWDGREAWVADAGSRNGTTVNGAAIHARSALLPGDVLRVGGLALRFEDEPAATVGDDTEPGAMRWGNAFGRDNYGAINQAGRDVHIQSWHTHHHEDDEAVDELFQGRGPGRVLILVGSIVALAGFAAWVYVILSGFAAGDDTSFDPTDIKLFGAPLMFIGFAAFLGGGVVAGIGNSMATAARARASRGDPFSDMHFQP
jgi:hypothetical protein